MDLPLELSIHLRGLADSIGAGDAPLGRSMVALDDDLRAAVASFSGLRLTLVLGDWPVTLTWFTGLDGAEPATSLRLALAVLGPGFDPDSRIVLYAGRAGALVDLAADLVYWHGDRGDRDNGDRLVALDVDLPPESTGSEISGLAEYATMHRAVGVLLDRGQTPEQAQGTLRRAAATSGITVPTYAAGLLRAEADRRAARERG